MPIGTRTSRFITRGLATCVALGGLASTASGAPPVEELHRLANEIQALRTANDALVERLDEQETNPSLDEQRVHELRGITQAVLDDARLRTARSGSGRSVGYVPGAGFQLASQDGDFTLRISGQLQVRWAFNDNPSRQDYEPADYVRAGAGLPSEATGNRSGWGFSVPRAKIGFRGTMFDEAWSWRVRGKFSSTTGDFGFEDVWIRHGSGDGLELTIGQFKAPFLRESLVSSRFQLAVDRSVVNQFFGMRRGLGVGVRYRNETISLHGYYGNGGSTALDASARNTSSADNPTQYAFAGRLEYKLSGDWDQFRTLTGGVGQETGVMIGLAGMAQEYRGSVSADGSFGLPTLLPAAILSDMSLDGSTVWGVTADISAKFDSISLFAAAVWQQYDVSGQGDPFGNPAARSDYALSTVNPWGFVLQGGYSTTESWELFARYAWSDSDLSSYTLTGPGLPFSAEVPLVSSTWSVLTLGSNHFINDNTKLTVDWSINLDDSFLGLSESGLESLGWGSGDESGQWLLRAQLQLLF